MRLSNYYLPLLKEKPSNATIDSHILMLRSGMIKQVSKGIYTFLPLGLKVLQKIEKIIQDELDNIGCNRLAMSILQPIDLWEKTGRDKPYGSEMLTIKDRHNENLIYSPTNEEMIVDIFNMIDHKKLPIKWYQINWKFRDEIRPRFGLLRAREFLMMDLYTFDLDSDSAMKTYQKLFDVSLEIFRKLGIIAVPMKADTGQIGGDFSHEFILLTNNGESKVFFDKNKYNNFCTNYEQINYSSIDQNWAFTEEKYDIKKCEELKYDIQEARGIEIGQVFFIDTKYTKLMNASVQGKNGEKIYPEMCTLGIGVSRLIAAIIESSHDEKGIIWPKEISPFDLMLINLDPKDEKVTEKCDDFYQKMKSEGIDVLYDDTLSSVGEKRAIADLLGFPTQIEIGKKLLMTNQYELKDRKSGIKEIKFF